MPFVEEFNVIPILRFVFDGIKQSPSTPPLIAALEKSPYAIPLIASAHSATTAHNYEPFPIL